MHLYKDAEGGIYQMTNKNETLMHRDGDFPCPACGLPMLDAGGGGTFDICEYCGWEDDNIQLDEPNYEGGANHPSLNQVKALIKQGLGASGDPLPKIRRDGNDTYIIND
jgi:hypothetical protein